MKKGIKIVIGIISSVLILAVLVLIGGRVYFRFPVREYYKNSQKAFKIPGLNDGSVQQGLAYFNGVFYVTAYKSGGDASEISAVDATSGKEIKRIKLADESGQAFTGHVGGITVSEEYVYVADKKGLMVFLTSDIEQCENGGTIVAKGLFLTQTVGQNGISSQDEDESFGVAFTHIENDRIYVGEFYREENYPTPDSHKYTTEAGDKNSALILEYKLDKSAEYGISSKIERAFSICGLVQGMCFDEDGRIYLSTSYATAFSHIKVYENPQQEGEITVLGQTVPRYALDSSCLKNDIKIPPMSEEIVTVDGKLYVMCESASNKYIFGKLTSAAYCYATDLSKFR